MRTLGFRTHVMLALAAAAGLVLSLGRPWYAAAPAKHPDKVADIGDINGPLTGFFRCTQARLFFGPQARFFREAGGFFGLAL